MRFSHIWSDVLSVFREAWRAYITVIETTPGLERRLLASHPLKGTIMSVTRTFANWVKFRQTVIELNRMSSRELQDLGIDRADIRRVARAAVI